MNQQFFELAKEKQQRILNAAMEVFATNDYKRASTDLIAAKSGVSKGLLFYYFHNKKELYMYVFQYSIEQTVAAFHKQPAKSTDFFEILESGAKLKIEMTSNNPYLTDFIMRAYYSEHEEVSEDMKKALTDIMSKSYKTYFTNLDISKFKEGVDIITLYKILLWMGDGYINEKRRSNIKLNVAETAKDFSKYMNLFKQAFYKDEYLN